MKRAAVTALLGNGSRRGSPTAPKKRFKASGSVAIWLPRPISKAGDWLDCVDKRSTMCCWDNLN